MLRFILLVACFQASICTNSYDDLKPAIVLDDSTSKAVQKVSAHVAVRFGNSAFIFGGWDHGVFLDDCFIYEFDSKFQTRAQKCKLPSPRAFHQAAVFNNRVVFVGGIGARRLNYSFLDVFSMDTQSWDSNAMKGDEMEGRWGHSLTNVKNYSLVLGGFVKSRGYTNDLFAIHEDLTVQNLTAKMKGDIPPALSGHTAVLLDGQLLVFGGYAYSSETFQEVFFDSLFSLNVDTLTWTRISSIFKPSARAFHAAFVWNENSMVIIGGRNTSSVISDAFSWFSENRSWGIFPVKVGLERMAAVTSPASEIVLFGGWDGLQTSDSISTISFQTVKFVDWGDGIAIAFIVVYMLLVVFHLVVMLVVQLNSHHPAIKMTSPLFHRIILLGIIFGYTIVFPFIGKPTKSTCLARIWIGGLSFVLIFAPLFLKTYRILKIWTMCENLSQGGIHWVKDKPLMIFVGLLVVLEAVFLIIWTEVDPPLPNLSAVTGNKKEMVAKCATSNAGFGAAYFSLAGCLILVGVLITFKTKDAKVNFNEAKLISYAIYNLAIAGAIFIPLVAVINLDYQVEFILTMVGILFAITGTSFPLFLPKFYFLNQSVASTSNKSTSTTKDPKSSK